MANRFWDQDSTDVPSRLAEPTVCEAGELKSLLNTIAGQLADADRRHTTALSQMQERLAALTQEAQILKPRVPEQYSSAFDRIEAGMAELSAKIASNGGDAAQLSQMSVEDAERGPDRASDAAPRYAPQTTAEHPVALRSAADNVPQMSNRHYANVDTFDVIESSGTSQDEDPWDQNAADALASVYGMEPSSSRAPQAAVQSAESGHAPEPSQTVPPQFAPAIDVPTGPDLGWLEARFNELSNRLDQSLSEASSGRGSSDISQRIEIAERNLSGLLETVATRSDVDGMRLIEAHVGELVDHLDGAHQQLQRLDAIEAHLGDLSAKLDQVRDAVQGHSMAAPAAQDFELIASKAASAAAQKFASAIPQSPPDGDTRALIEQLMHESRQGEENTNALLDTLQQAMIRLLDRVDAMELAQHQNFQAHEIDLARSTPVEPIGLRTAPQSESAMLNAAVATVATNNTLARDGDHGEIELDMPPVESPSDDVIQAEPKSPEKLRQDFIADARRAKMRLTANEDDKLDVIISKPTEEPASAPGRTARGAKAPAVAVSAGAAQSRKLELNSPRARLVVLGLVTICAAAGLWYSFDFANPFADPSNVVVKQTGPAASAATSKKVEKSKSVAVEQKESRSELEPTDGANIPADSGAAKSEQEPKLNLHEDIHGEIIPGDMTVGSADFMIRGVAVDTTDDVSFADLQRAKRQRAMALASNKLGQVAGTNTPATAIALDPSQAVPGTSQSQDGLSSIVKSGIAHSSPLDMPPAMVGPLSLRLAAANGDPSAQFQVGSRLAEGKGDEQNFAEAAKWYQRAASAGFAQAQYRLGTLYERGLGLKADPARARDWYTKSAELGNVKAMHNLAVLSANQRGTSPDYATAAKWFAEAADRGLSDSQFNLAVLYENGLGVSQDLKRAYKWLDVAARGGDAEAVRRRDILRGKLTAEDLAAAETLVKSWKAKSVDPLVNDARTAGEAWKKNPANGVSG